VDDMHRKKIAGGGGGGEPNKKIAMVENLGGTKGFFFSEGGREVLGSRSHGGRLKKPDKARGEK